MIAQERLGLQMVNKLPKRKGVKCIKEFLQGEVVGICEFNKHIFVATKHGLYCYPDDMEIINTEDQQNGKGE